MGTEVDLHPVHFHGRLPLKVRKLNRKLNCPEEAWLWVLLLGEDWEQLTEKMFRKQWAEE